MHRSVVARVPLGVAANGAGENDRFRIRRCTPIDAAIVASLGARLFTQAYGPTHPEPELSRYLAKSFSEADLAIELFDPEVAVLLVEGIDGDPIAYAHLRETGARLPPAVPRERAYEIQRFYVDEAWHGKGVARALMDASRDLARGGGADVIWVQVWTKAPRALAFYAKSGFTIVGTAPFHFGARVDDDYLMCKSV